ncbi:hypothetical protein J2752_002297 [Halarchaeum rubridurum]|uniref:Uncharacterized protein n=1 Tax=Halarchaeum rubridurum TaxID=489911 RepID=A0A830G241_9EURY|nr:hypothetical protein [Halarchaeum rubridurum]MBP1955374.1 hypothetical protein [Halarchaeum rubridurum]GGM71857.1 hypothetical protein GCM10009017_22270 [Halarchaeum rubridurum]
MNDVSDNATQDDERGNNVPQLPEGDDPRDGIETYDTTDGVVLYDSENPLAWLKATHAVPLGDQR